MRLFVARRAGAAGLRREGLPGGERAGRSGNLRKPEVLRQLADLPAAVYQGRVDRRLRHHDRDVPEGRNPEDAGGSTGRLSRAPARKKADFASAFSFLQSGRGHLLSSASASPSIPSSWILRVKVLRPQPSRWAASMRRPPV